MALCKFVLAGVVAEADWIFSLGEACASKFSRRFEADFLDGEDCPIAEFRFKYRDRGMYLFLILEYY